MASLALTVYFITWYGVPLVVSGLTCDVGMGMNLGTQALKGHGGMVRYGSPALF